jgi:transcriptional regulator with XRE-family HTH domain
MITNKKISNNLRFYRKQAGFTQDDVSAILGYKSNNVIWNYEQGRRFPNGENLICLENLYQATGDKFYPNFSEQRLKEMAVRGRERFHLLMELSPTFNLNRRLEAFKDFLSRAANAQDQNSVNIESISFAKYRLLAIAPFYQGFGFTVFEENGRLLDWGIACCPISNRKIKRSKQKFLNNCLKKIKRKISFFQPQVIVMEDYSAKTSRRSYAIQFFQHSISQLAKKERIKICRFSREAVRKAFAPFRATTKEEISQVLGEFFPHLLPAPRPRENYKSELAKMNIFDAAALAFTYLYRQNPP